MNLSNERTKIIEGSWWSSGGGGHDHESGDPCQTPHCSLHCWSRCGGGGGDHDLPRGCAPHAPCPEVHLHVVQLRGESHARTMQQHFI